MKRNLLLTLVFVAVFSLGIVAGAFFYDTRTGPGDLLRDAMTGGKSLAQVIKGHLALEPPYERPLYHPVRSDKTGVTRYDPARVQPGVTLLTSGHRSSAVIIDFEGNVLHEWFMPFTRAWPEQDHIPFPVPDDYIFLRKAHAFPNGDLLAFYEAPDTTPNAYGMIKLDRDSDLIWKYPGPVHHDFDVGPDGTIYGLINRIVEKPVPGKETLPQPILEDGVVILNRDGEPVKEVFLVDAIARGPYASLLSHIDPKIGAGDIFHANSVDLLSAEMAGAHPYAREGQLLISLKHLHALIILDPETETVVWATLGPWRDQHDGDFLANGHLMVFDNEGHLGPGGESQVLEFDPMTGAIAWSYTGTPDDVFFSQIRSSQQRLANGNTLIIESDAGRLFEVTPDGTIVWEYWNPHRAGPDDGYVAVLAEEERLDPADYPFLAESGRPDSAR